VRFLARAIKRPPPPTPPPLTTPIPPFLPPSAGYHRHFAHRAYSATYAMKVLLMLMGTAAVEGSIKWWARGHRAHHKYVDTPKDPYAVVKGFWYAHIGWMLKRDPKDPKRDGKQGYADISDLVDPKTEEGKLNAPIVNFQNKFYLPLAILMVRARRGDTCWPTHTTPARGARPVPHFFLPHSPLSPPLPHSFSALRSPLWCPL
jgi:hypothetical protein